MLTPRTRPTWLQDAPCRRAVWIAPSIWPSRLAQLRDQTLQVGQDSDRLDVGTPLSLKHVALERRVVVTAPVLVRYGRTLAPAPAARARREEAG